MTTLAQNEMKVMGHRGRSSLLPENSRSSIIAALCEADGSEFDVQRTADNVMVVLHDQSLARTALPWRTTTTSALPQRRQQEETESVDGSSADDAVEKRVGTCGLTRLEYLKLVNTNVNDLTFDEIKSVPIGRPHALNAEGTDVAAASTPGSKNSNGSQRELSVPEMGQTLMNLPEALDILSQINKALGGDYEGVMVQDAEKNGGPSYAKKHFLVEIKRGDEISAVLVARDVLASSCGPEEVTLIGFDLAPMVAAKALLPNFNTILVFRQKSEEAALDAIEKAAAVGMDGIDLRADVKTVTERVVKAAKAKNLEVVVWYSAKGMPGSDVPSVWSCLQSRGVDVFTSDCPPALENWLAADHTVLDATLAGVVCDDGDCALSSSLPPSPRQSSLPFLAEARLDLAEETEMREEKRGL